MRKLIALILILFSAFAPVVFRASADELDEVTEELADQEEKLSELEKKKNQLANDITSASVSLYQISNELSQAEEELTKIQEELVKRGEILKRWEENRNLLIRDLYKRSRLSPVDIFFSSDNLGDSTKQLQYYDENLELLEDRITLLVGEITTFEKNKAKAQELRDEFADLKSQVSSSLAYSQNQFSSTSSQLAQVKSTIKNLTAKQEQLILEKFAATEGSETVGESPPASESLPPTSFSQAWMVATYGYPHRIGMSQYGAYGRAKKGQSYKKILSAYYKVSQSSIKNYAPKTKIHVKGCSVGPPPWVSGGWSKSTCKNKGYTWYDKDVNFESYIKGLGEMPTSWGSSSSGGMEALKAQAVAARSYAWAYANGNGNTICPSTHCQVYLGYEKGSYWNQAVDSTKDKTIVVGSSPLKAFYHSTAGGYTISTKQWISYWTYNDGIKDFHSASGKFYEQIAGAPWFHTGWGSRTGSGYNPWMKEEEFADIFNAILLYNHNNNYSQYLSPIDQGGWSLSKVRSELSSLDITPFNSISAVVTTFTGGNEANTASVYVSGSGMTRTFSGREFRDMFNLRSRGTLGIWTYRFDIGYCSLTSCTNPDFH